MLTNLLAYSSTVNTLTPWLINWAKNNNLKLVTVGKLAALKFLVARD